MSDTERESVYDQAAIAGYRTLKSMVADPSRPGA